MNIGVRNDVLESVAPQMESKEESKEDDTPEDIPQAEKPIPLIPVPSLSRPPSSLIPAVIVPEQNPKPEETKRPSFSSYCILRL